MLFQTSSFAKIPEPWKISSSFSKTPIKFFFWDTLYINKIKLTLKHECDFKVPLMPFEVKYHFIKLTEGFHKIYNLAKVLKSSSNVFLRDVEKLTFLVKIK